jgi:hypothetical protein
LVLGEVCRQNILPSLKYILKKYPKKFSSFDFREAFSRLPDGCFETLDFLVNSCGDLLSYIKNPEHARYLVEKKGVIPNRVHLSSKTSAIIECIRQYFASHPDVTLQILVLNMISSINFSKIIPLFLREVGKYYWNEKMIRRTYGGETKVHVKNMHAKMFRFFRPQLLLSHAGDQGVTEAFRYFSDEEVYEYAMKRGGIRSAYEKGYFDLAKYLVDRMYPVRDTIFDQACKKGYVEIVKHLVEKDPEIQCRNPKILQMISYRPYCQEVVAFLTKKS